MQQAQRQLLPFRSNTRQRMQQFATAAITLGNQVSIELPRVGFLSGIMLTLSAAVTLAGATTLTLGSPWNVLKRIKVNLNTGAASIYDTSGMGAYLVNDRMIRSAYDPTNPGLTNALTANGVNNWTFSLYIPIAINDQQQFALGLINLQAPEIRCTLDLTFATAGTDLVAANFTSITGTVVCSYVYYEVPDPRRVLFPPLVLHRILEERQAITAVGDQVYTFPRGGTILSLIHLVTLNGHFAIPSAEPGATGVGEIDSLRLILNKTDTLYSLPARAQALWQAINKGMGAGIGGVLSNAGLAWEWNFLDAGVTRIGEGDFRDTLNSEAISTLESILTVNSAAVIGATAYLDSIRRIYQPLQA